MKILVMFIVGYLIGALNFSIILSRFFLKQDVRTMGSKNAGFTNTLRSFGKMKGAIVFLGDILKTVLVMVIARKYGGGNEFVMYAAGLGAILGHIYPVYFGFRGGKGILTIISSFVMLDPIHGIIDIIFTLAIIFGTGYVSLGSLFLCLFFPLDSLVMHFGDIPRLVYSLVACAIGIAKHKDNIKRLLNGTENRFGKHKKQR